MARMTASDMISEVSGIVGETDEVLSDNQILRFINRVYLRLATKYDLPELDASTTITTADGTAEYELSVSDVAKILELTDTSNGVRLEAMSRYQFDQWTQTTSTTTGTPFYWTITGVGSNNRLQVSFYPTPDDAYSVTVRYRKKPSELVTTPSATSAIIHEGWDEVLVNMAAAYALRYVGDFQKAQVFWTEAKGAEAEILDNMYYPHEQPIRMGSVAGWRGR